MSAAGKGSHDHVGAGAVLRHFGPYASKYKGLILGSSGAMFCEVGLRLLEPWPLKFILDGVLKQSGSSATGFALLDTMPARALLLWCVVGLVAVVGLGALAEYARRVGFALAGNLVLTEIRADLFAHIQTLSLSFHSRRKTGDLTTRLTTDVGRLQEVISTAVLPLMVHILTVLAIAVIMLVKQWELALVAFAVLPLFWLSTSRLGREIRDTARREREREGDVGAIATEALGSIRVVQSLGGEGEHRKHFKARSISSLREGVRGKRLSARLLSTADIFIAVGTAIVLWYGATLVLREALTIGDLWLFLAYHKNMTRPIRNVAKYSGRTAKALASAERIVELFETAPMIREAPDAIEAPERIEQVRFESVRFAYEAGTPAVEDASLEARVGTVTALVGASGAGKSTLMSLLLRLYDPDAGRITAEGVDLKQYKVDSWRRRIAVVPQETTLFAATVRENIAFGCTGLSEERVTEAAALAGAEEFIQRLPLGYDTVLGERGETLSEGQRQRLAIARAVARRAPILIFDEPTASLDNHNSRLIREAIRTISRDRICFVISHDLRTVTTADQIICLDQGHLVERGVHEDLLKLGGCYAAMHRLQGGGRVAPEAVDA